MSKPLSIDLHRTQLWSGEPERLSLSRPASNFDVVEDRFGGARTLGRLFSIARSSHQCQSCVIEDIADVGLLLDDTDEILKLGYKCSPENKRLLFFDAKGSLVGYVIARNDHVCGEKPEWYVFESVFPKYSHPHNCVPRPGHYRVRAGESIESVVGVMYAQQNRRNKRCAQVALRALLSRLDRLQDISYSQINSFAREFPSELEDFSPENGLSAAQIEGVLNRLGVRYRSINYEKVAIEAAEAWAKKRDWNGVDEQVKCSEIEKRRAEEFKSLHSSMKYTKLLYDGAESGLGALVGFKTFDGVEKSLHIIPIFGHTFNKDSWVPDSRKFYFSPEDGNAAAYVQSDNWTSSFIGHDDNVGCDYCIPRAYLRTEDVTYAVELFAPGAVFSGIEAESAAYKVLRALLRQVNCEDSRWMMRIAAAAANGDIILRSVCTTSGAYLKHLGEKEDWHHNRENQGVIVGFSKLQMPRILWIVEVSLPQLFPANERKLGEVVIDATEEDLPNALGVDGINTTLLSAVSWIRLPGAYYIPNAIPPEDEEDLIRFDKVNSAFKSHLPVFVLSS